MYRVVSYDDGATFSELVSLDEILALDKEFLNNKHNLTRKEIRQLYDINDVEKTARLFNREYEWIIKRRFDDAMEKMVNDY